MTRITVSGLLAIAMACASPLAAEDISVEEIVEKANHMSYYQGEDGRATVNMTITDRQGRPREKQFTILRKDTEEDRDGQQKFYVHFSQPADERGTVFMVWKNVGADDDRWLYLPGLDLVRRIAASDERSSFVGSHFFYEDVSGRGIEEDHHELVETTANYYVLRNTPKDPDAVEFDSYKVWIHKGTFLPVKAEYEKGGEVYRTMEVLSVEEIQGFTTVTKSRMSDTNIGANTVIEYSSVEYNTGIPEDIFTERYLRNPPREYLR